MFSFSRPLVFTLAAVALLTGAAFALVHRDRTVAIDTNPIQSETRAGAFTNQPAPDRDNDGLLDWAEAIWGTSPENPDSDGDGYKDGEEVAKGYDPTKPGDARIATPLLAKEGAENDNLTQGLAFLLAQRVFEQNQKLALDPTEKTKNISAPSLGEAELRELLGTLLSPKSGEAKLTIPPRIPASVEGQRYLGELASILKTELQPLQASVPLALANVVEKGDQELIKRIIQAHQNALRRLAGIKPPSGWQPIHEAERHLLTESQSFFEDIARAKEDPLRALVAMRRYPLLVEQAENLANILRLLRPNT